jgi:Skp family chaperone for outer membrane proteins
MDTIKILLIATVALLLGALGWTIHNVRNAPEQAGADELARLRRQIDEVRVEQGRVQTEMELQALRQAQPAETPKDESSVSALKAKLDEQEAALKTLSAEKQKAERDAKVSKEEAGVIAQHDVESRDQTARRAHLIGQALLIARIKEYIEDPNSGNFATLEVLMPANVKPGDILAVRRNTGILGQFKVSEVNAEGAIANPMQAFPNTKPQAGDELIVPPQD